MHKSLHAVSLLIALAVPAISFAAEGRTLYNELTTKSGSKIPYAVHLPDGFDPESSYPVLLGPGDGVEGDKFHAVCWSANSAGIFRWVTDHASRFHSITGMAGNPSGVSKQDIQALKSVKVQFVVGENDAYWQSSARNAFEKLKLGGVDTVFEVVPDGEHVMTELVGKGFMQKLEKLRTK